MPARFVMADLKPQVYKDPRPAGVLHAFHERARTREPGLGLRRSCAVILTPPTLLFYRTRAIGTENVPAAGPVILAPNHFSQMDHFFAAVYLRRKVRFMAKSQLFGNRVPQLHLPPRRRLPGPPRAPRRGGVQDRPRDPRPRRLRADVRRGRALAHAATSASRGPASAGIALESGVPGRPGRDPRLAGVRGWKRLRFPKVTVQYGEPMSFDRVESPTREQQQEAAERSSTASARCTSALEEKGRRGVIKALREGLPAGPSRRPVRAQSPLAGR